MKEFNDDMFIVINKKRFSEMERAGAEYYKIFSSILSLFIYEYEHTTGKAMNQKYIVCNQDEPYAERVKAMILAESAPDLPALLARCEPWIELSRDSVSRTISNRIMTSDELRDCVADLSELDTLLADLAEALK